MRRLFFEALSVGLILVSLFFFYWSLKFLAKPDYIAGILATLIGFTVIRVGAEITRITHTEEEDAQRE